MNTVLVLAVCVAVASSFDHGNPRSPFSDVLDVRGWPWMGPPSPLSDHHHHSDHSLSLNDDSDFMLTFEDYPDSSFPMDAMDEHDSKIMEAKQRCQDDFLLLRRLLQEQGRPLRGPQQVFPWFFPMFRVPYLPEQGKDETDVVKKPTHADEIPQQEEENFGVHEGSEPTDGDYEEDSPTPGPEWHILPYLPEVPDADDLPDNYDNATHSVHVVNGTRVEVNTTTIKETDDSVTTFLHTETFNILPDADSEDETPEEKEDTSEGTPTTEEEVTTVKTTEEPHVEEETVNEQPSFVHAVPAELVRAEDEMNAIDYQPARGVPSQPKTKPGSKLSASYVKRPSGGKNKDKDAKQPPKDLSGDTLVNNHPRDAQRGKPTDPDAETIHDEFL